LKMAALLREGDGPAGSPAENRDATPESATSSSTS
jgi:hypothetical protein